MSEHHVPIQSTAKMKEMMFVYYMTAKQARENGQKVAWITSGGPVEILYAAGVIPIYPENHAAMCGVTRMADDLAAVAEDQGFSRDLCSYARTDLGSIATGNSPVGGLPEPDFLVCCNNICGTVLKWYQELQRIFGCPLIFIDAPFQYDCDRDEAIAYVRQQLEDMIDEVGKITGKPIDREELEQVLQKSDEATGLWREIQDLLAHKPAPMNSFDTFLQMGPIVTLRGTDQCTEYYQLLKAEIAQRVAEGIASVKDEQYRLGWDNLAIWYQVKKLANKFADHHAALVVSTYPESFCYRPRYEQARDHLDEIAAAYIAGYINHGFAYRENELAEMARKFSLDGFVMHSNRSCRAYSFGQYDLAKKLEEKHGLPTLMIEADMCDTRTWSDEQINTRIEAFMETLGAQPSTV